MYIIREVTEKDILPMVKIYNSNIRFLKSHLGCSEVDDDFIRR